MGSQRESHSVLIVEDDEGIGGSLLRALRGEGYLPVWCRSVAETRHHVVADFDVILLDLGLPDGDGLDYCRRLRSDLPGMPIIMLTARGTEADIVVGLDAGADDYLVKPFRLAELFARLRAHTRRQRARADVDGLLIVGDLSLDTASHRVWLRGVSLELRPKEFDLLALLMRNPGRVVTRADAMSRVWDEHWFGSTKTLDVHVAALRQRLGEAGPDHSRITTLRGVGYRLELPGSDEVDR